MTDAEMIAKHKELDDKSSELEDQLANISAEYISLEMEWLQTHSCSCGLMGLLCRGHSQPRKEL
jgi:hypothetical protein